MSDARRFNHCEFRHLLSRWHNPISGRDYWGHVHEGEALACAYFDSLGWPRLTTYREID